MFLNANEPMINENSTFLDKLGLGGSTLLIGMLVVFAVLGIIFVALQIMRAVFTKNAIKAKQARRAEEAQQKAAPAPAAVEESEPEAAAPASDDTAVIAAIVAAISAYTGKAPEGFRVVSFKKRR